MVALAQQVLFSANNHFAKRAGRKVRDAPGHLASQRKHLRADGPRGCGIQAQTAGNDDGLAGADQLHAQYHEEQLVAVAEYLLEAQPRWPAPPARRRK